jgi:hypothetical protein
VNAVFVCVSVFVCTRTIARMRERDRELVRIACIRRLFAFFHLSIYLCMIHEAAAISEQCSTDWRPRFHIFLVMIILTCFLKRSFRSGYIDWRFHNM